MAIDKNTVVKEAQKFVAKGQFDKAIAEWKKLLRESPNDPNIYNTIGDLCLKKDSKTEAVDAYQKAADILAADGFTSKAIALYKKVLNIDPGKIEVHLALGDLNAEKGITGAALESYKTVADHYTSQKNTVKALGIYQKMADLNPSNVTFRTKLGGMYEKEGMNAEAAKAYLNAANVHVSKNAFQEARQLFERVLTLDPANKEVYHKAGIVYFKEGKFVEACKALKPAFEADPSNRELSDAYLEALSKADKPAEAEAVLKKLIAQDGGRIELREKLYQLYRSIKEYEKALGEAAAVVQAKTESGEVEAAENILKGFVSENPQFAPGRYKLAEFYASVYRKDDAVKELLQAAELLSGQNDREGAKALLIRALEIDPGMSEARTRLDALETPESAPQTVPEAAVLEPSPLAEQAAPTAAPFAPPAVVAPEEDAAINDAFTEADVLIKYGLAFKAMDQLEGLAGRYPENVRLRTKLRDLYREHGSIDQAVRHALLLSDLYAKQGSTDMAEAALQAAVEMAPEDPAVLARLGKTPAAAAPSAFEEAPPALEVPQAAAGGNIPFEGLDTELPPLEEAAPSEAHPAPETPRREEPAAGVDLDEVWAEAEFYYQQGLFDEAKKHYAKIIELAPGDRRAVDRLSEISREEDETRAFSKLTEAVEGLENAVPSGAGEGELATSASDEEAVQSLMKEIAEMRKEQQAASPPPRKAGRKSRPAPAEGEPVVSAASQAKKPAGEDFFDLGAELEEETAGAVSAEHREGASEDFFDLAAELRDELSNVTVAARPAQPAAEQSLDDIFEEFKKGVEQQAVKEDTDTHYNLGVAYKEMGLLDDAVAEFIMTPEGEPRFVKSRYMLGLCYMEKGEYQNAIAEIRNALNYSDSLGVDAENRIGMLYDLGLAYQGFGNIKDAISTFQDISETDPGYRDTAAKLNELRQGEFISLEQLKDDIEKEISAKFLEEGERIEREEKSRKTEKIKS